jgi:hypothetical protein
MRDIVSAFGVLANDHVDFGCARRRGARAAWRELVGKSTLMRQL